MTDWIVGVDTSHHQGLMDWLKAWQAGARYAFPRATAIWPTGGLYQDGQWQNTAQNIRAYFTQLGAYHYFRPQWSAVNQANYFLDTLVQQLGPISTWQPDEDAHSKFFRIGGKVWRLWLDVEDDGAGRTPQQVTNAVKAFINQVQVRTGQTEWVGIYTRGELWNRITAPDPMFARLALWIARYHSGIDHPWLDNPLYKPRDWNNWSFWQWSADGNGRGREFGAQSDSIDLNRAQIIDGEPPPPDIDHELMLLVAELADAVDVASDAVAVTRERMIALQEYLAGG
jgi:GH25 family lysozyme M1 (1,4-beta-N-acetylmuramidase)